MYGPQHVNEFIGGLLVAIMCYVVFVFSFFFTRALRRASNRAEENRRQRREPPSEPDTDIVRYPSLLTRIEDPLTHYERPALYDPQQVADLLRPRQPPGPIWQNHRLWEYDHQQNLYEPPAAEDEPEPDDRDMPVRFQGGRRVSN